MSYTTQQKNFIRQQLIDVLVADYDKNVSVLTQAVVDITGEKVDSDTVRRFLKKVNYSNQTEEYFPSQKTTEIYVQYLTHPDVDVITEKEIENSEKDYSQLPEKLALFFSDSKGGVDIYYNGEYSKSGPPNVVRSRKPPSSTLKISSKSTDQYFLVKKHTHKTVLQKKKHQDSIVNNINKTYINREGWGVFIDKDVLLVLLKNLKTGGTSSYVSIADPVKNSQSNRVEKLLFARHQKIVFQQEVVEQNYSTSEVHQRVVENFMEYQRVGDFSRKNNVVPAIMNNDDGNTNGGDKDLSTSPFTKKRRGRASVIREDKNDYKDKKERQVMDDYLGEKFLGAVSNLETEEMEQLIKKGAPVNHTSEETGNTALHIAAAYCDWETVDILLASGECNLLIRNNDGYLASMMGGLNVETDYDLEQVDKLRKLEYAQGKEKGIVPRIHGDVPIEGGPT